ncbi:hypothetical protein PT974_09372 [Cladobotryum mycophilum]|uniref:Uncharacterized protein n=1 Tax=Cladobotryum mycophilum TaxID=491253 RepID=A0ABR0SH49_9HYPO
MNSSEGQLSTARSDPLARQTFQLVVIEFNSINLSTFPTTPRAAAAAAATADLSRRRTSASNDRYETHEYTSSPKQRQQPTLHQTRAQTQTPPDPITRYDTPSSQPRPLHRTPKFDASPDPQPRPVHVAAASVGFYPSILSLDDGTSSTGFGSSLFDGSPGQYRRRRQDSQRLAEAHNEDPSDPAYPNDTDAHHFNRKDLPPALRISKHTHTAILFALEEALRQPYPFSSDFVEESASMSDLMVSGGLPVTSNGAGPSASVRRPTAAPAPTSSPSGIRGPRMIMQERAAREARQRAEAEQQALERSRAEQEARLLEESRRRAERRSAGVAPGQGSTAETHQPIDAHDPSYAAPSRQSPPRAYPVPGSQQPPQSASGARPGEPGTQGIDVSKPRNSFPHAFERWETLSAHWEGLTSYWIRKLEQNKEEISRDPMSQQLARQVTDLSAAGANLFHAVVELQRLRASSERKFQRWFFETRAELERSHEVNAMLEAALEKERRTRDQAIQEAVDHERGVSKTQKQLIEMRKELSISKEEARRAWEELGRREQEERDRTFSLQSGHPTIVGGVQVVPMTQNAPSRHASTREQSSYQSEYTTRPTYSIETQAAQAAQAQAQASPRSAGGSSTQYQPQVASQQEAIRRAAGGSEGGYSEGEYLIDAQGNFVLDVHGKRIPFAVPPSSYAGSDVEAEDYDTPATTNPPSGGLEPSSTSAPQGQWTGAYSNPQDYSGQGFGAPGWESVPRHHHPTRLSDVIEEEDERSQRSQKSRTSGSQRRG